MKNKLDGIEEILLMGPGPSCIHDSVYEALGLKTLGHTARKENVNRVLTALKEVLNK